MCLIIKTQKNPLPPANNERPRRAAAIAGEEKRQLSAQFEAELDEWGLIITELNLDGPENLQEALSDPEWTQTTKRELNSLEEAGTWIEAKDVPPNAKIINSKMVFKQKRDSTKKSRLVAIGSQQNLDPIERSSPTLTWTTLLIILVYGFMKRWIAAQLDVPSAYVNEVVQDKLKPLYMRLPKELGNTIVELQKCI